MMLKSWCLFLGWAVCSHLGFVFIIFNYEKNILKHLAIWIFQKMEKWEKNHIIAIALKETAIISFLGFIILIFFYQGRFLMCLLLADFFVFVSTLSFNFI